MNLSDLEEAFVFVAGADFGERMAMICPQTGQICYRSDMSGLDEIPEQAYDSDHWHVVPHWSELGLGRELVLSFVSDRLPNDLNWVKRIFRRPGAYANYKDLLAERGKLEEWYEFENARQREAILEWCRSKVIDVTE
jgi:hypothetical protein